VPEKKGSVLVYTDDEKKAALDLAARIGIRAAARELKTHPTSIRRFREALPEYWSDLQARGDVAPARRVRTAENLEDLADGYTAREFEALERAEKLIKTADAKELAALIKAMGGSRGVATAGARGYRGEDAQVVEHNINFDVLQKAAEAILDRARPPIQVPNLAELEE
jgi:hypothetical protein